MAERLAGEAEEQVLDRQFGHPPPRPGARAVEVRGDAVRLAAEAAAIAGGLGNRSLLSRALVDHGGLLRRAGRLAEAAAVLERAVETAGA